MEALTIGQPIVFDGKGALLHEVGHAVLQLMVGCPVVSVVCRSSGLAQWALPSAKSS